MSPARVAALLACALVALVVLPATARAQATWRLEQPAPPAGALFKVPLGTPGDIQCLGANRCLLAVEGNATVARGLYFFDGAAWRPLSTVCGGPGDTTRIAWASPTEFWTVSEPSLPRRGAGRGLCRVRDGEVVGSYSTPDQSEDPFQTLTAAACDGPTNCWFGGRGAIDPSGGRAGAFHLRFDGSTLTSVYAPQGRGVSDVVASGGGSFLETSLAGVQREDRQTEVVLAQPEPKAQLVGHIEGGEVRRDPFTVRDRDGVGAAATELLAADASPGQQWLVGGGAASGPEAPAGTSAPRPPVAVRRAGGGFEEVPIPDDAFAAGDRFVDVAAIPGEDAAWVAVQPYADRDSPTAEAVVARIGADGGVRRVTLPEGDGAGRGAASKIECTSGSDCWLATTAGWLFHLTDGAAVAQTTDPAFARVISFRPNEAAAQFIPDAPPVDDSRLFAPPPTETPEEVATAEAEPEPEQLRALLFRIARPQLSRRLVLTLRFSVRRRARVQLLGRRGGRVVARSRYVTFEPGRRVLRLRLDRRRYPTALRFRTRELELPDAPAAAPTPAPADGTPGDAPAPDSSGELPSSPELRGLLAAASRERGR